MDRRKARFYNTDLAEYMIPMNADVPAAEVIILPEEDHEINELGIRGIGELGNVGTNAAIANALFHATGVRLRNLPIRLEQSSFECRQPGTIIRSTAIGNEMGR